MIEISKVSLPYFLGRKYRNPNTKIPTTTNLIGMMISVPNRKGKDFLCEVYGSAALFHRELCLYVPLSDPIREFIKNR